MILIFFVKIKIAHAILDRDLNPKIKILNIVLFLFLAFVICRSYFVSNNKKAPTNREIFFLEIDQYGCQIIQNLMLISDLKKLFKKIAPKKVTVDPKNTLFLGTGRYSFSCTVFPSDLKSASTYELFDTHIDLFQKKLNFASRRDFFDTKIINPNYKD